MPIPTSWPCHREPERLASSIATILSLGAVGAGSLAQAQAVDAPVALNAPGAALVPAERLSLRKPSQVPAGQPVVEGELIFPVDPGSDCYVLDNFGDGRDAGSRLHEGIDIMGSAGRAVYAVAGRRR